MIELDPRTYGAIWGLLTLIVGAGWAAYGILGGGNVFLVIMVVLSMGLLGGAGIVLRRRRTP